MSTNWGTFDNIDRPGDAERRDPRNARDPAVVADLIAWMANSPGHPVLNEVTITPLLEGGWP